MSTIIFVVSLLWPAPGPLSTVETVTEAVEDAGPMRYRGIEQLLARFEAEAAQNR